MSLDSQVITKEELEQVDIRVGKIVEASLIEGARHSTHLLMIDLGSEIGVKKSCARLPRYELGELEGKLVMCVVNLESIQIGKHISEVLTVGVPDGDGECLLLVPDAQVPLGGRLY